MKVRKTESMTAEEFVKHINLRHKGCGELADLQGLTPGAVNRERDRFTWEAYHRRLHEVRSYEHEH